MQVRTTVETVVRMLHAVALYAIGLAALAMVAATTLSTLGLLPWLSLAAGWGDVPHPRAGMIAQVGGTALLCLLFAFFPSNGRMLALERSHRDFRMTMTDVSNAYHAAHVADRKGAFTLSSEFDQVRERIEYLRGHPDLKLLEADVLTLAAQMSQQSHRLAQVYSEDRVARARDFLAQRQKEVEDQQALIARATATCREIMRWTAQVELAEAGVAAQLDQLDGELRAVLPVLGYDIDGVRRSAPSEAARPDNIVALSAPGAMTAAMTAAE